MITDSRNEQLHSLAEKGANVLDIVSPHWYKSVDETQIDMNDCFSCVLGQIFGGYSDGLEAIDGASKVIPALAYVQEECPSSDSNVNIALGQSFGFSIPLLSDDREWVVLGKAWAAEIQERRNRDAGIVSSGKVIIHLGQEYGEDTVPPDSTTE